MAPVLIIEDDPSISMMLSEVLELNGVRVISFESGRACLNALPAEVPALIVSDMILPHMRAQELLEKIRDHYGDHEIRAIFMSARTLDELGETELSQGSVEFVSKPFNIQTFVSKIVGLIGDTGVD